MDEGEADGWIGEDNSDVRRFLIDEMGFTEPEIRAHIHETFREAGCEELPMPMADLEPNIRNRLKTAYQKRQTLS